MTATTFVLSYICGAALLALWSFQRLPGFAPRGVRAALGHVGAAILVLNLAVPPAFVLAVESGSTLGLLAGVLAVALPPLAYVFLSALWAFRVAQGALPGFGG